MKILKQILITEMILKNKLCNLIILKTLNCQSLTLTHQCQFSKHKLIKINRSLLHFQYLLEKRKMLYFFDINTLNKDIKKITFDIDEKTRKLLYCNHLIQYKCNDIKTCYEISDEVKCQAEPCEWNVENENYNFCSDPNSTEQDAFQNDFDTILNDKFQFENKNCGFL